MLETLGGFCFIVSTVLFITGLILYMDAEACKIRSKMHIWLFTWCAVFFILGSVIFIVCDSRHRVDYENYNVMLYNETDTIYLKNGKMGD